MLYQIRPLMTMINRLPLNRVVSYHRYQTLMSDDRHQSSHSMWNDRVNSLIIVLYWSFISSNCVSTVMVNICNDIYSAPRVVMWPGFVIASLSHNSILRRYITWYLLIRFCNMICTRICTCMYISLGYVWNITMSKSICGLFEYTLSQANVQKKCIIYVFGSVKFKFDENWIKSHRCTWRQIISQ